MGAIAVIVAAVVYAAMSLVLRGIARVKKVPGTTLPIGVALFASVLIVLPTLCGLAEACRRHERGDAEDQPPGSPRFR